MKEQRKNKGNHIIKVQKNQTKGLAKGLDNILTSYLMDKTLGEICYTHEHTSNTRTWTACHLIIEAICEQDVGLMKLIIQRIDGGIPQANERDKFANIIGNAIDQVLDQPLCERTQLDFSNDSGIIAMAKAICLAATTTVGNNVAKRKDRQMAAEILLNRTGGMKSEPVKDSDKKVYVDPSWALNAPSN